MGAGIVEVFARNGIAVHAVEISGTALERGRATLTGSTDPAVAKGKLAGADRGGLLGQIRGTPAMADLASVVWVVRAVPPQLAPHSPIFARRHTVIPHTACSL